MDHTAPTALDPSRVVSGTGRSVFNELLPGASFQSDFVSFSLAVVPKSATPLLVAFGLA